jgi:hypothetical protein
MVASVGAWSAVLAVLVGAEPSPAVISVDPGDGAVMLISAPKGASPVTSSSDVFRIAAPLLREHTRLRLVSPEQAGLDKRRLDACAGATRLGCWTREARRDYDLALVNTPELASAPFESVVAHLDPRAPKVLFVILLVPERGRDKLSCLMIELEPALRAVHRGRSGGSSSIEDAIFETAVFSRIGTETIENTADLDAVLHTLVLRDLRPVLERQNRWEPYGQIALTTVEADLAVEVDGRPVGRSAAGLNELVAVEPGKRRVVVSRPGDERLLPFVAEVEVKRGESVALRAELFASSLWAHRVSLYGGLGAAVGGAVLLGAAVAGIGAARTEDVCVRGTCSPAPGGFLTSCDVLRPGSAPCGGVLLAPLGYGLLAFGAAAAGGALFEDAETDDSAWWRLAIGLATGALAYGASALLSGR